MGLKLQGRDVRDQGRRRGLSQVSRPCKENFRRSRGDNDFHVRFGRSPCTAAADSFKEKKPLLYAATAANAEAIGNLAKAAGCPLAVKGEGSLESVIALTEKLSAMGLKDIVIDTGTRDLKKAFEEQIMIRRAALKDRFRPWGSPRSSWPMKSVDGIMEEALVAATFVAKYGGDNRYERLPAARRFFLFCSNG